MDQPGRTIAPNIAATIAPEFAAVVVALEAERLGLRRDLGEEIEAPGQMTYGSQAAAASQVFAQQRDLALREQSERRLRAVERALARASAGTYGTCEACGRRIPPERLEVMPWAPTCVACHVAGR